MVREPFQCFAKLAIHCQRFYKLENTQHCSLRTPQVIHTSLEDGKPSRNVHILIIFGAHSTLLTPESNYVDCQSSIIINHTIRTLVIFIQEYRRNWTNVFSFICIRNVLLNKKLRPLKLETPKENCPQSSKPNVYVIMSFIL